MDDKIEQISLSELIAILIKRRKIIAITLVVFLMFGLLQTFVFSKSKYASEVVLELHTLEREESQPAASSSAVYRLIENIVRADDMSFDAYVSELRSKEVLETTIKDLGLEDTYTVNDLRNILSVSSNNELENINIKVTSRDPKQSAAIANKLVENFIKHIDKVSKEKTLRTLEIIKKQRDLEGEKYAQAIDEYKEEVKQSKTAYELELEIKGVYDQLTLYKLNLNDLEIKSEGILGALEERKKNNGNDESMVLRPNDGEGYIYLGSGSEALEVDLAETKARIKTTQSKIIELQESVKTLEDEYQEVEFTDSITRQKIKLSKESYEAFAQKYEELNMTNSIDVGDISITKISEAVASTKAIGTNKGVKIAIFIILGLMTGIILSYLIEYLDIMRLRKANKG